MSISICDRRLAANIALASALLGCSVLILFPPTRFAIYPQCPIHQYLGILCPGCGATRALAALLSGHLREALRLNALFVLLLPFVVFAAITTYRRALYSGELCLPRISTPALAAMLIITIAFTVARNLTR